ncbi:MAG TPA: DEAD/DEAH box helicase family protein [Planctomycetota bacterium]|nr:DEAD/DEAH box helicase family protein [Planctomycetota bacterium]
MEPKDYQQTTLATVKRYLELLADWRAKAESVPELEIDFPGKAWEKAEVRRPYRSRKNGIREPLPNYCLKIPTGGGKTFLAVKVIDLTNTHYRRKRTGLVLWIVPTTQIYRQTIQSLRDRDHPYRQHLDLASGGRTVILEKMDRFSRQDVVENLVVLMLMLPSANRKTKETLRVFKDSGGFQDFFPAEDDIEGQKALLKRVPNLDTFEAAGGFWGRQVKTSLGNTLRTLSPLIILDEGHKAYSEGAQGTLRGFNPCMIIELSATPTKGSNVLVEISGAALNREDMIKLDLHVTNRASMDWKDTLLAAHNKLEVLRAKAHDYEASSGAYIRPICLIQVERTGKDQRGGKFIHSEQVRDHLVKTLGIPSDEIAVKTAEKDELKAFDDTGGLMTRDCRIRYIITKQALQEGWDCAFAYVLAILTNPGSKNALTQLVGRILRQPFARKTKVKELDESYVFCFQQKAGVLLDAIRAGFQKEGLGDLKGQIVEDEEGAGGEEDVEQIGIRERFQEAARRTVLPLFEVRDDRSWRPVNYEMDILARIQWSEVDLSPLFSLTLSMVDDKDIETVVTQSDDEKEVIKQKEVKALPEAGIRVDPVFMARQLFDIVPNPWQAHEFAEATLRRLTHKCGERRVANNFVFIIGEARKRLEAEADRLAERVFAQLLDANQLRFLVIGNDFSFPPTLPIRKSEKKLTLKDGRQLQLSLFEHVPEGQFDTDLEKAVAWYLEGQERMFFWYRNRVRHDYHIQGWRRSRIYPDFIFTTSEAPGQKDYQCVYVLETKGRHLADYEDTRYKKKVLDLCNKEAKRKDWNKFAPGMKDKVLRFEVLAEDEWERKLNELLQAPDEP